MHPLSGEGREYLIFEEFLLTVNATLWHIAYIFQF